MISGAEVVDGGLGDDSITAVLIENASTMTGGEGSDEFTLDLTRDSGDALLTGSVIRDFTVAGDEADVLQVLLDDGDAADELSVVPVTGTTNVQLVLTQGATSTVLVEITDGVTNGFTLDNVVIVDAPVAAPVAV